MSQAYSDPKRESDPYALPDIEVFWSEGCANEHEHPDGDYEACAQEEPGWYYWTCFPGCLPDSDPVGPFPTEAEALEDAREGMDE